MVMLNFIKTVQCDSLFYMSVLVQGKVELKGMLDTGLMVTMLSADVGPAGLREARVLQSESPAPVDIFLVSCGG